MLSLALTLAAVVQVAPVGQEYSGRRGELDVDPPRIESPSISIDARLDEPEWTAAARLDETFNLSCVVMFREIPLFAEGLRGSETRIGPSLRIQPGEELRVEASYTWVDLARTDNGTHFSTAHIPRLRLQYQFSKSLLTRIIGQYDLEQREPLRHPVTGQQVLIRGVLQDARERVNFTGQALVSFEPSPGTIFFVGYSRVMNGQYGLDLGEKELQQDGFFTKLSSLFRL